MTTAAEQAVLRVDVDDTVSTVSVSGLITEFNAGGSYECVPVKFTGAGTGLLDTSRLQFDWEPTNGRIVDERTAKPYPLIEREGPIHVPNVTGEVVTGSGKGPLGLLAGLDVGGNTTSGFASLSRTSLWRKMNNTAYGFKAVQHLQPLVAQYHGTVSTDNASVGCGLFPLSSYGITGGGYNTSKANIAILCFSAVGVPAAWDATSGWGLEIWHTATLVATLKLSADTYSTAADDLYPDTATGATHPTGTATTLIFEQGIPFYSSGPLQPVSFILRRYTGGGTPANLVDPTVTAYFEESLYPEP
jgi:hypothetical protein